MTDAQRLQAGVLVLRTADGAEAARLSAPPALAIMAANGRPPEVLVWGSRCFVCHSDAKGFRYLEGLLYPLADNTPRF